MRARRSRSLMPRLQRRALAVLLPLLLAACATSPNTPAGSIELVTTVKGKSFAGASCVVSNLAGRWPVQTPATVVVGEPNGDLRVVCEHPGYRSSEVLYRLPASGLGNSATRVSVGVGGGSFGSASGVGVSLGIGLPLGSMRQSYPARVTVDLTPSSDAP